MVKPAVGATRYRYVPVTDSCHQGYGDNRQVWWNLYEGGEWGGEVQIENVGISAGPSAVVYSQQALKHI